MGHIYNHQHTSDHEAELALESLHTHFRWTPMKMRRVLSRLRILQWVQVHDHSVTLTNRGEQAVVSFRKENLPAAQA